MADVTCANCGEPFDTYHMQYDEIWEAVSAGHLTEVQAKDWNGLLSDTDVAKGFELLGWKFAGSIYAILACPCCKDKVPLPDAQERIGMVSLVADMFGDDEDGLISTLEDIAY